MRRSSLKTAKPQPIRHSPALIKKVFVDEPVSRVKHLSHAVFRPGDTAFAHSHEDAFEVFYCLKGRMNEKVSLREETILLPISLS